VVDISIEDSIGGNLIRGENELIERLLSPDLDPTKLDDIKPILSMLHRVYTDRWNLFCEKDCTDWMSEIVQNLGQLECLMALIGMELPRESIYEFSECGMIQGGEVVIGLNRMLAEASRAVETVSTLQDVLCTSNEGCDIDDICVAEPNSLLFATATAGSDIDDICVAMANTLDAKINDKRESWRLDLDI
jgi:hypothetical protein